MHDAPSYRIQIVGRDTELGVLPLAGLVLAEPDQIEASKAHCPHHVAFGPTIGTPGFGWCRVDAQAMMIRADWPRVGCAQWHHGAKAVSCAKARRHDDDQTPLNHLGLDEAAAEIADEESARIGMKLQWHEVTRRATRQAPRIALPGNKSYCFTLPAANPEASFVCSGRNRSSVGAVVSAAAAMMLPHSAVSSPKKA